MRLSEFLRDRKPEIVAEWVSFARTIRDDLDEPTLLDHAGEIVRKLSEDICKPQNAREESEKSMGRGAEQTMRTVGQEHAGERIAAGFRLDHLVAEYRALRGTVMRLWNDAGDGDPAGVTRFHEAIDEVLTEATIRYTQTVTQQREQFLAMLGHDLRNPLGAVLVTAQMLSKSQNVGEKEARAAGRIHSSAERMTRMVHDLLDMTRTHLGSGIPIVRSGIDLSEVSAKAVAEFKDAYPDCAVELRTEKTLQGEWDGDRVTQVLLNLLVNARHHGSPRQPITITARDLGHEVVLAVHKFGRPIPPQSQEMIFDPMVRLSERDSGVSTGMGLGLFIAREVVRAHGGSIEVDSTADAGTTFTVHLPRLNASRTEVESTVQAQP